MPTTKHKIEALKLARIRIASDESQYICLALIYVAGRRPDLEKACQYLKSYIDKALGGHTELYGWRAAQTGHRFAAYSRTSMRKARTAWIDWMIAQYEKP